MLLNPSRHHGLLGEPGFRKWVLDRAHKETSLIPRDLLFHSISVLPSAISLDKNLFFHSLSLSVLSMLPTFFSNVGAQRAASCKISKTLLELGSLSLLLANYSHIYEIHCDAPTFTPACFFNFGTVLMNIGIFSTHMIANRHHRSRIGNDLKTSISIVLVYLFFNGIVAYMANQLFQDLYIQGNSSF